MIGEKFVTGSREYAESIINTVREPLLALDQNLRVVSASRSFYKVFQVKPEETVGQLIYDLGNKQWDIPKLRELLETILPQKTSFDDYEVEHNFATIGRRIMLLNARQIQRAWGKKRIILLALEDITERKEIETGLETTRKELAVIKKSADAAHEFAESVINTVREPLISLDQDLRVVTVSRSFYEFFQVTPEETVGQLIYDLGNKQWDIPKLRELLETILPQQTSFDDYEVDHVFTTIGRRIMLLNARQIEQAWGKERILLLAFEDISERRRLEDLLSESEERYRRLFETASDGIVLLEKKQGRIIHANPAAEQMLGYSATESLGKKLQDIGVTLDTTDFPAIMKSLNRSGILNYADVPVKTKSGEDLYTDIYLVDRAKLAQCNIRDVTARKLAERELQTALIKAHEGEARLGAIMSSMGEGLSIQDPEYVIIYQNQVLKDLVGDHVGEHCYAAYENNEQICANCPIQKAYSDGGTHRSERTVTIGQTTRYREVTASPLRDMQGNIVAVIEVIRDVSEQKELESQLRQAQKMEAVGTLTGGIAHDFNNILNVIMGYGHIVMDSLESDNPARDDMHEVLAAAERAATLTRRLLVFSRKQVVELKPFDLNALIQDLRKMLDRVIRENIALHLEFTPAPLMVLADAGMIEQVLMNLVTNARDAMLEGGKLSITTSLTELAEAYTTAQGYGKPGRYALITVSDTGMGMDAETQKRIFEPFFTTKGVGKGTGLGLAISYGILKQINGYIKVYSEPGQGTVFNIYLPLGEAASSPDSKTAMAAPVKGGHETVLVAEDDAAVRELSKRILESFGYTVIAAVDGQDAITKFIENRERINLLLFDMIMPKENGKEAAEEIRKINPQIKILFVSGYTMDLITSKEFTAAGFAFIRKPYQSRELLLKVREVLDKNRQSIRFDDTGVNR
ncbi:MAG: PAS domain S-box protein [Desulfobulbaceae bacterium]|nr:PAS domain S-box protein [Desulfobulbaceae bacterium]